MSRSIVAAIAVVFACGCGGTPATPSKATPSASSTATTDAPKGKKKGGNSTTAKKGVAPVVAPKADEPAKSAEKPAEETKVEEKKVEEKKDGAAVDAPAATQVAATEKTKAEVIPASFTKTVTLSVPDMNCEFACYPKVKKTLESVGGVAGMKPDIENHTVTFLVDPAKFQEEKALAALKEAKYPATVKVADAK